MYVVFALSHGRGVKVLTVRLGVGGTVVVKHLFGETRS